MSLGVRYRIIHKIKPKKVPIKQPIDARRCSLRWRCAGSGMGGASRPAVPLVRMCRYWTMESWGEYVKVRFGENIFKYWQGPFHNRYLSALCEYKHDLTDGYPGPGTVHLFLGRINSCLDMKSE